MPGFINVGALSPNGDNFKTKTALKAALRAAPDQVRFYATSLFHEGKSVLTIADLGILRTVTVDGDVVEVTITPTYSGCPAMDMITLDIDTALARAGIKARIRTTLSPAWTTDWMSQAGKAKLLEFLALLQRGRGKPDETFQRRTPIGIKADVMVARPVAPGGGGAGKIKRA